jgi:hypothetical protein
MRSRGESRLGRTILGVAVAVVIAAAVMLFVFMMLDRVAWSRDLGQWGDTDPLIKKWFQGLMQPDTVKDPLPISCCGEGDAYWADVTRIRDGKMFAVITDNRPDGTCAEHSTCRIHEDPGNEYEVPPQKIVGLEQALQGNPTGHIIVFLGGSVYWHEDHRTRDVLCYVGNVGT